MPLYHTRDVKISVLTPARIQYTPIPRPSLKGITQDPASVSKLMRQILIVAILALVACHDASGASPVGLEHATTERPAPEFPTRDPGQWINSPPISMEDLRGQVVLLEIWTYGCINCRRSLPWIASLEERFGERGLRIVGLHAPEFEEERDVENVRRQVKDLAIHHPVVLDNDLEMWKALGNRAWPAFYLIDRAGRIRYVQTGETHEGSSWAATFERILGSLLDESN